MKLSLQAISEFKEIYQRQFTVALADDEVNQKGIELLKLFEIVYRQVPVKDAPMLNQLYSQHKLS